MHILFVGMPFYGYEHKIKAEMEKQGHLVDMIYDAPDLSYLGRVVFSGHRYEKLCHAHQQAQLKKIQRDYDFVLTIVGRWMSVDFLDGLRNLLPNAKFVLYLWDDVARVQNFATSCHYYDKIISFDYSDCQHYNFTFLPLFYLNTEKKVEKTCDVYSSLLLHSDRLEIVNMISDKYPDKILDFYITVPSRILFFRYKLKYLFAKDKYKTVRFMHLRNLSSDENFINMRKARSMLDIQHFSQNGLTIRTVESLGCKTKLITTNADIVNYDFYNPNNILVIDRKDVVIPDSFFLTPYESPDDSICMKYSLKTWVRCILEGLSLTYRTNSLQKASK